jgi:hypothetical protein
VDPLAALTLLAHGLLAHGPIAHGGVAGAVVEALLALLLVGLAAAVWLGRGDHEDEDEEIGEGGP